MARALPEQGGASRLVALKAVAPGYPLRGAIRLVDPQDADGVPATGVPPRGEAWPDAPGMAVLPESPPLRESI